MDTVRRLNMISLLADRYSELSHEEALSLIYSLEWDRLIWLDETELVAEYSQYITITEGYNDTNK